MQQAFIPFLDLHRINAPYLPEFEEALRRTVDAGWFLHGEHCRRFEQNFATFCGTSFCIGVANGLDALTLVLLTKKLLARWAEGDEVLLPAHTFVATAQAVVRAGLSPILVDVSANDYLMDATQIEAKITARTRALLPVHLYGKVCDMNKMRQIARQHGLFVLEDAAQAHGASGWIDGHSQRVGALADAAAFSFYPGKNLGALGDGGCVTTNDAELAEVVSTLSNYGAREKYKHELPGLNSRLDELQAAFLDIKLRHLERDNGLRQKIALRYLEEIHHPQISLPYGGGREAASESVFHIFPIFSQQRDALQQALEQRGVQTLIHYPTPLHRQLGLKSYLPESLIFEQADRIAQTELSLPISPRMTEEEVSTIIDTINGLKL